MADTPFAVQSALRAGSGTHLCPVCNMISECIFDEPENRAHVCTKCGSDFTIVQGKGILL